MNALLERNGTIVPTHEDTRLATESSRILSMRPTSHPHIQFEDGKTLPLPPALFQAPTQLLTEISQGHAVTLIPIHAELTTQEAADYLNVSRPYLIKLLETGKIAHHKVGTHRRVRFTDVQTFQRTQTEQRARMLDELAAQAQELGLGY
jgi:excisionase family DNA binding protein